MDKPKCVDRMDFCGRVLFAVPIPSTKLVDPWKCWNVRPGQSYASDKKTHKGYFLSEACSSDVRSFQAFWFMDVTM